MKTKTKGAYETLVFVFNALEQIPSFDEISKSLQFFINFSFQRFFMIFSFARSFLLRTINTWNFIALSGTQWSQKSTFLKDFFGIIISHFTLLFLLPLIWGSVLQKLLEYVEKVLTKFSLKLCGKVALFLARLIMPTNRLNFRMYSQQIVALLLGL